ncbi:MAG: hypothetical protein NTX25_00920, partial [Proteobacteria bacterium]|nr:hypothetical protein [Pseudomonadota bacterium]
LYSKSFGEGVSNQADAYTKIASGIAAKLAANGACGADALTSASCLAKINDSNFPAPVTLDGSSLNLPGLTIEKDQDIKTVLSIYTKGLDQKISEGVLEGAKSLERDGAIGISDTEIGALYEVVNTAPLFFSVGGGLRLPTGKCQNLGTHEIETGGCVTDLGLRINLDYLPFDSFMLSWQNQSEKMLMKGKIERDNTTQDIAWNGVRQVGFIYLKPSLSSLNSRLNVLAPKVGLTYKLNSAKELDDVEEARERGYQSLASLGLDLTRYQLPIQMDLEYTKPIKGENQIFAPTTTTLTLKLFAKL